MKIKDIEEFTAIYNLLNDDLIPTDEETLVSLIEFSADKYYSGEELISDTQYDWLVESLRLINPSNPVIAGLAGDEYNSAGYKRVENGLTMGTLEKCQDLGEFHKWWNLHSNGRKFLVSAKQDGSGILLYYENGKYTLGTSRGDGYTGFDKTELYSLLNFPKEGLRYQGKPFTGYIRGEAELSNKNFMYFPDKKNPRNACAGLLNRKFSDLTSEKKEQISKIDIIAYDIRSDMLPTETKSERYQLLETWGFSTPEWLLTDSYDEIISFREGLSSIRGTDKELYGLDGIVLNVNDYDSDDQMLKVQKNAVAVKFDLMVATTTLNGIEWSSSGRFFTPVALLEPIVLDGATISRASLCNLRVINEDLDGMRIGDRVRVERRGQVIPKVIAKVS